METLSRAFVCVECDQPIHENGEQNHVFTERTFKSGQGWEYTEEFGPFCPDCACKRLGVDRTQLNALLAQNS